MDCIYLADMINALTPLLLMTFGGLVLILGFIAVRRECRQLINRILRAKEFGLKFGPLELEAKAIDEFQEAIDLEFADESVNKQKVKELVEHQIKSLLSEIRRDLTGVNLRWEQRLVVKGSIRVIRESGETLFATVLEQSKNGLRFEGPSSNKLHRKERIRIQVAASSHFPFRLPQHLEVVRVKKRKNGNYFYGAKALEADWKNTLVTSCGS